VQTHKKNWTIGLVANHLMSWGGGIHLFSLILDGLKNAPWQLPSRFVIFVQGYPDAQAWSDPVYRFVINCGIGTFGNKIGRRSFAQLAGYYDFDKLSLLLSELNESLPVRVFRSADHLDRLCMSMKVDCLMPLPSSLSSSIRTPAVGYIPDLQHLFFPDFFSNEEVKVRDKDFSLLAHNLSHIIVNSRHTASTCRNAFGSSSASFISLPFAATPNSEWFDSECHRLEKYDLPKSYFLVSNQFWIHKNHETLFKAFSLGVKSGWPSSIGLVCTGNTNDYRHPDHYQNLVSFVNESGIANQVKILGHIPKRDQIEIMKSSIALIQPTLFEGGPGGGSAYDAISLGLPVILSDIEVNRELDSMGFDLSYFDPLDPFKLKAVMESFIYNSSKPSFPAVDLISASFARRQELGAVLATVIESAVESKKVTQA
jgi:glycosyltransferase involved in cell wall biosynthesis